jgi:phage host-nuclease inhibitor protein Gam
MAKKSLEDLRALAREYSAALRRFSMIKAEIDRKKAEIETKYLDRFKAAATESCDARAALVSAIDRNRGLFTDGAKTDTVDDVKFGVVKARDSLSFEHDEAHTIALIKDELRDLAPVLVTTKEFLAVSALRALPDEDLAAIGVERVIGEDEVVVSMTTGASIEKAALAAGR